MPPVSRPSQSMNAPVRPMTAESITITRYRTVDVDGLKLFYREAGASEAPALLLLHGFPTSSHMYRDLIPALADRYHVIAPDLPGFGFTEAPERKGFKYSFEHLAEVIERFTEAVGLDRYALYVFDYGAPIGFRLAIRHPERITAVISQNGNAYLQGLSEGWNPIQAYWKEPSPENRVAMRAFLKPEATEWQYRHGVPAPRRSGRTIRMPRSICSKPVILHSKAKDRRLRSSSATSSPANCRNTSSERDLSLPRTEKEPCHVQDNTNHRRQQRLWPYNC